MPAEVKFNSSKKATEKKKGMRLYRKAEKQCWFCPFIFCFERERGD